MDLRSNKKVLAIRDLLFGNRYKLDGQIFHVPPATKRAARRALFNQSYELPERKLISNWLPENEPVLELGSSFGIVSRFIRKKIGSEVRHVMVEANPDLIEVCKANYGQFSDSTCKLINGAIGSESNKPVRFVVTPGFHDSQILNEDDKKSGMGEVIEVQGLQLQDIVENEFGNNKYNLVCDIEGAEFEMLEKGSKALRNCNCMIIEIHPEVFEQSGRSINQFEEMLMANGYSIKQRMMNVLAAIRSN